MDADGTRKRIGLVVDFVGVLRELKKALRFDSEDVSGVIEDLDLLMEDFFGKITEAKAAWLDDGGAGGLDQRLESVVYGHFLDPEARAAFFEAYKEIEALWEILSPSPELRDHIETFKRLAQLYAAVRNAYAAQIGFVADLACKTSRLVQEGAGQEGLGRLTKSVTFDLKTVEVLAGEPGSDEGKVFNLVRGIREEAAAYGDAVPVLLPLKERAERIVKDLEDRKTTGMTAMDRLAGLAREKEAAAQAARDSGLSARAFAVHWRLKDDANLAATGIATIDLAREADTLLERFPNAAVNADEQRRLRAALYRPLLALEKDARSQVVDRILAILLSEATNASV